MIAPETELERRIVADPQWRRGAAWGVPRPGHPEGAVVRHIAEVLANIDAAEPAPRDRERLRFVALVHDTFKHAVDTRRPRAGDNHHAAIARRFAERYSDDAQLLTVVELHDEAYSAWLKGHRDGDWAAAAARARALLERLGDARLLYLRFYRADARTGDKRPEPLEWFERLVGSCDQA